MHLVRLPRIGAVAAWRAEARRLAASGARAEDILWTQGEGDDLFAENTPPAPGPSTALTLPREAVETIESALHHSDPERFARAYAIVLRLSRGALRWGDRSDPALHRLLAQDKAVRHDVHKMHAFVRFREIGGPEAPRRAFAAWFEPEHPIAERAAPFFARRFGDMDFCIATPGITVRFEDGALSFEETRDRTPPPEDAAEALWRAYFANIFNPARLMVSAMTAEMPRKYWKNLPEAALIPELIRGAPARARAMHEAAPSAPHPRTEKLRPARARLPEGLSLATLKPALDACRRCPLGACATQGVAGEGPSEAPLMIVGEQPGDAEDLAGRPFVGPAGQLFDRLAGEAGLDRRATWVTNAVKHFKFAPRGKRRLHRRPDAGEIEACRWWLDAERRLIRPRLILALGATALQALTGRGGDAQARRGGVESTPDGTPVLATLHPAGLLRRPDPARRAEAEAGLREDLARAAALTRG